MAALGFFWPTVTTGDAGGDTGLTTFVAADGAVEVVVDVLLESGGTLPAVRALLDAGSALARDETEFLPFAFDFTAAWCTTVLDPAFKTVFDSALIAGFDSDFTTAFDVASGFFVGPLGGAG